MTDKAFSRYRWIRPAMKSLLNKYDRFFFKTEEDAQRYYRLGLDPIMGTITGDMKFDAPMLVRTGDKLRAVREAAGLSEDVFLFVAGSTRPGEEAIIANAYGELAVDFKNLALVIAPRHVERAAEVGSLLAARGIDYGTYGSNSDKHKVVIVDRMGVLNDLYLAANISYVGGTLVDIGGHNILEPVWAGSPVLFGPSLFNVEEAAEYIIRNNYGGQVRSEEDLVSQLRKMLSGGIIYSTKKASDLETSPTSVIGAYILEKLSNA